MERPAKQHNYRSHRLSNGWNPGGRPDLRNGYALLIMMMIATVLLISLAAALPSVYVEGQREKEKELMFRGEQYARAIELFHTQFNRYPTNVKELLHTNGLSFLRRAYTDPMSKGGKWRFIHATANGIILDSKFLKSPNQRNPVNGNNPGSGLNSQTPNADNSQSGTATTGQQSNPGYGGFSLFGNQSTGLTSGTNSEPGSESPSEQNGQSNGNFSMFNSDNGSLGTYIVGVASTSKKQSIRVFENRAEYDQWEFLGIPGAPGSPPTLQIGGAQAQAPQNGMPSPGAGSQTGPVMGGIGGSNPE